jgi:hypothetical protein
MILEHLEATGSSDAAEDARKIYVAASRTQRLLVMAIPKSRVVRFEALLQACGCTTVRHDI